MSWNDGGEDPDGGAVGGTAGNAPGAGPGEAEGTGYGGDIGGYSGYGGGAGVGPHGTQAAGPTADMMDQAADMNAAALSGGLVDSAGGMEFGGMGVPGSQGNVPGGQHAGSAGDSFSNAVAALDAAIGSMPNLEPGGITYGTQESPVGAAGNLPGMGYAEGQIAAPGMEAFGGYGLAGAAPGIGAFGGYGPGGWGGGTTQGGVAAPGIGAFGGYSADPGLEAFGGQGPQQGPGVGYGSGALGEMGNPPGYGVATGIGNPMGYGMHSAPATAAQEGTLDGLAAQAQAERDAEAAAAEDAMALARDNPYGLDQSGLQGMRSAEAEDAMALARDVTAPRDAAATAFREEEANRMFGRDRTTMSQAEADALEGWSGGPQATGQDIDIEDENEDYSGMPTGATVDQTVGALIQAIQDPKEAKNRGWLAHDLARSILGLPPSTPESRAKDALSQLESQGQQEAMEMDVSTGEDDRTRMERVKAISNFRKQYKWAKDMSAKEIQAYMDNPALLKLKISNEQMRSMDPRNMTANDIRQLWSPAMSA